MPQTEQTPQTNVGNDNDVLQQLNTLAYAVSHDMNTPLRHVKGFADLLERNMHDQMDARSESYMHHLKDATHKLDSMMEGVLKYSRITTRGKPFRPVDSAEVVAEVISETIETRMRTPLISYLNLPKIDADRDQFKMMWQELIKNAIEYAHPQRLPDVHITCNRAGDKWIFTIADKGLGMPASVVKRVFTLFYRGVLEKDHPEGHGIGLALCERIVQRHGGHIWCESEEGFGSRFHFTWPIYEWREKLDKLQPKPQ